MRTTLKNGVTIKNYYMDGYLRANLDIAKTAILKDWDMTFLVDGTEGAGKSVLAQQVAFFCDETFHIGRIAFTPKGLKNCILKATRYQAVVYDEAYTGLSSRGTMSAVNKALVSLLAEIRQKNLFVIVVMPTFFDLDRYVALWRSRALLHVYTGENFTRGYLAFYNSDRKKDLYVNGKKYYSYRIPKPNFVGKFTNFYTVDEQEYKELKLKALTDRADDQEDKIQEKQIDEALWKKVTALDTINHKTKYTVLGMPESTYFLKIRKEKTDNLYEGES